MSLQEKFQIITPAKPEAEAQWENPAFVRRTLEYGPSGYYAKFNRMPVGYITGDNGMAQFTAGFGGDTDVSGGVTPKSLGQGYERKDMKNSDDQYTGEHVDLFYGDSGGFVERNNYLDRL
jgi:hypothetical protein